MGCLGRYFANWVALRGSFSVFLENGAPLEFFWGKWPPPPLEKNPRSAPVVQTSEKTVKLIYKQF